MFFPAVMDVDLRSVPGECYLQRLGSTNKEVFGVKSNGDFSLENLIIVREGVRSRFNDVISGVVCADPLRVFVKQEPHKMSKIEEGRLRLIMSVSLIDSLVDRILFMRLMCMVVDKFADSKILIGWSPVKGGYRLIENLFQGRSVSIDKKAWDWSVPHWLLEIVKRVIIDLAVDAPMWWRNAVEARFRCLFVHPLFVFKDGAVGEQAKPGIMKSGCYLTILINSLGQLILHEMAISRLNLDRRLTEPIVVMGDDSLQKWFDGVTQYVEYLQSLGFRLEVQTHDDEPEFAGFTYKKGYRPAYRQKHYFALSHLDTNREVALSTLKNYQVLYYFDDEMRTLLRGMARILRMPEAVVDKDTLRAIAQG